MVAGFSGYGSHRKLHSFPTRRSSDLRGGTDLGPGGTSIGAGARPSFAGSRFRLAGSRRGSAPRLADRKSTRLNSSHANISYAVFCLKKKRASVLSTLRPEMV